MEPVPKQLPSLEEISKRLADMDQKILLERLLTFSQLSAKLGRMASGVLADVSENKLADDYPRDEQYNKGVLWATASLYEALFPVFNEILPEISKQMRSLGELYHMDNKEH